MTKCHLTLLAAFLLLYCACKPDRPQGPSLSEYGASSQSTQSALFEKYVIELLNASPDRAARMQDSVMAIAESDSLQWQRITEFEESFLLDPNSPYRNEELYIPVVEHLLSSPLASEKQRMRAAWIEPRLKLNRPGQPAADFSFISPKGRRERLHAIIDARHPQRTILFFSNPGCPNCKEITEALSNSLLVQSMLEDGRLLVINVYPDEDVQAWLDYLPNYPAEWVCGYDADQILNSGTHYWLRAIPSLYLLDEEKRVILKDAPLNQLIATLHQ